MRDRASFAFALVSVAAALDVVDGEVRDVRIAFGGVAHKPWRAHTAEAVLRGGAATAAAFTRRGRRRARRRRSRCATTPTRSTLARNMLVRTLAELAG